MKKQALELQHIDFYKTHGALVLQQVLSTSSVKDAKKDALFFTKSSLRNVWQNQLEFKKIILNKNLFSLSATLTHQHLMRIGYDHFFSTLDDLRAFFPAGSSISEKSSIDPIEIALLINLSSQTDLLDNQTHIFPYLAGSGCFIHPRKMLDFTPIEEAQGPFLLITYCKQTARYIFQKEDPYTHEGKKQGLVFGDIINSRSHPLLSLS